MQNRKSIVELPGWKKALAAKQRNKCSVEQCISLLLKGDRVALSQAITMVESNTASDKAFSQKLLQKCLQQKKNDSFRIGITGVPGVGKSTFIDCFGTYLVSLGYKVAVLAIDPTSGYSKGSILGDKTRMSKLACEENAYIRPSAAGESLGGVARKTRETIILCETSGFDVIIVETVGVGQSETTVHSMVDFFLLLLLIDSGDEIQGIKRGIMEMADAAVITKSDTNMKAAEYSASQFERTLKLFPKKNNWSPKVVTCSAQAKKGIDTVWNIIQEYKNGQLQNNLFKQKRGLQEKTWLHSLIWEKLKEDFFQDQKMVAKLLLLEQEVMAGNMLATFAVEELFLQDQCKGKL